MDNIDALLEGNLDDLADMPEFKAFPAGVHKASLELTYKQNDKKELVVNGTFAYLSAVELGDPMVAPPKAGDKAGIQMNMANEYGQGTFKMIGQALAKHMGVPPGNLTKMAVIEGVKGLEFQIVTTVQEGKKGSDQEGKEFLRLKAIEIAV